MLVIRCRRAARVREEDRIHGFALGRVAGGREAAIEQTLVGGEGFEEAGVALDRQASVRPELPNRHEFTVGKREALLRLAVKFQLEPIAGADLHRCGPGHKKAFGVAETDGGLAAVLSKDDPAFVGAPDLTEIALGKASIALEEERMLARLVRPDILFLR